jgi:nicotinate-nucleotide pyrophosphorylase (carboxylating)
MLALPLLDALIDRALEEDLAGGDLTTEACVDDAAQAVAVAAARRPLVVCGGVVFRRVFERLDSQVEFEALLPDGVMASEGTAFWRVAGRAGALLSAERTALNLVQRMSGTATMARQLISALPPGSKTRIVDTRKTTPGLRALERYAVRIGGAHNHRNDLGSAVLIKDNHIVAAGGLVRAIERARARAPHTSRIEVEVDTLAQLDLALEAGVDVLLIDNFTMADVHKAVARVKSARTRPILEASGGITRERIRELAEAGVDVISVGALTHSAPAADIGLDFSI